MPSPELPPRAAERLAARRQHVRAIRHRVIGLSVASMLATSGIVLVQMVTGHDPALSQTSDGATTTTVATRTTTSTPAHSTTTSTRTATSSTHTGTTTTRTATSPTHTTTSPSTVVTRAS